MCYTAIAPARRAGGMGFERVRPSRITSVSRESACAAKAPLLNRPRLAAGSVELTAGHDRAADRRKPDERFAAAVVVDGEQDELGLPEAERPTDPAGARFRRRVVAAENAHERVRSQF